MMREILNLKSRNANDVTENSGINHDKYQCRI